MVRIFSDFCFESLPVSTLASVGPSAAIRYTQSLAFLPPEFCLQFAASFFFAPFVVSLNHEEKYNLSDYA